MFRSFLFVAHALLRDGDEGLRDVQQHDVALKETSLRSLRSEHSSLSEEQTRLALFIFCPDGDGPRKMIKRAVRFAKLSGFQKEDIHVISARSDACSYFNYTTDPNATLEGDVAEVHPAKAGISFTELHNVIRKLALERKMPSYLWQHTDVAIVPDGEFSEGEQTLRDHLFADLESMRHADKKWGVIFYAYDWLAGFNLDFADKDDILMWDEELFHYGADCDMYYRFDQRGQNISNKEVKGGKIMHMLDNPGIDDLSLPTSAAAAVAWAERSGGFTIQEHAHNGAAYVGTNDSAYKVREKASWEHYLSKWGTTDCNIANMEQGLQYCKIGGTGWTAEQMAKCPRTPSQNPVQNKGQAIPAVPCEPFEDKPNEYWHLLLGARS